MKIDMLDRVLYWKWALSSYNDTVIHRDTSDKLTVILPYFSKERFRNINHMIRSLLRCDFISEIIVTNQNPDFDIIPYVRVKSPSLTVLNNNEKRHGSGYRWTIAKNIDSDYFIVIDDDFLVRPEQLAHLFDHLVKDPDIPHGLTGKLDVDGKYCRNMNAEVEIINQIYAVTKKHVDTYFYISEKIMEKYPEIFPIIEDCADDIIISMAGSDRPLIHDVGYNLRCYTAKKKGIALHKDNSFIKKRIALKNALREEFGDIPVT